MKMFSLEKFAERLSNLMVGNGDTTYSLASSIGMSAATISRYSRGLLTPMASTVEALADRYGVDPAWLMGAVVS